MTGTEYSEPSSGSEREDVDSVAQGDGENTGEKLTLEGRQKKLEQLRGKMRASARENRASLLEESNKARTTIRDQVRLEKQLKLAETLRLKADAEERGEDAERQKNWEWTIEENDEWEKKLARKARRADFEFHDDAHATRRKYKKDIDHLKPDLEAYNRQKEIALGLPAGSLSKAGQGSSSREPSSSSGSISTFNPTLGSNTELVPSQTAQQLAAESLYRDANSLLYADNKPSEEAIDRVVAKINQDVDKKRKFSRKRANEHDGDITYINERNRIFNKKIARYYDKYTTEIRNSFERGTAL